MRKTIVRLSAFAGIGLLSIAIAACGGRSTDKLTVSAVAASSGPLVKNVEISGVLAPNQTASVFTRLSGQAKEVTADIGEPVRADQLLIRIDTRELDAQLAVAKATVVAVQGQAAQARVNVDSAKDNLELAQKSYERMQALFDNRAVAQSQLDDARNKLELARGAYDNANKQYELLSSASLDQAQAQVRLIEVQIGNSLIDSPIGGVVTNRNINPGELASPGVPLMTIADTRVLKLLGTVSQDEVSLLEIGSTVQITVDGMPGATFEGTIAQVGPVAVSTGQYFPVVVRLENDGRLLAGMTAMASFALSGADAVLVPLSAVATIDGRPYVYVVKDGTVSQRRVTLGLANGSETEVTAGLQPGELVASSNVDLLRDGQQVTVAP